jgi:hypothetical protein
MDTKSIKTVSIPSVVGVGRTDKALSLSLGGIVKRGADTVRPTRVAFDGVEYLVGEGVSQFTKPVERMDFDRFVEGPELRALLYASLYPFLNGGSHKAALAIALPVQVIGNDEQAAEVERAMAAWMVGIHKFALNDVNATFEIMAIRCKIPQPVATWLDWGLNLDGQWDRSGAIKKPVLVVDQGFRTLDLCAVENGKINNRYTGGETLGMSRAAEMAVKSLARVHKVKLSLHEADALIRAVMAGDKARTYVDGDLVDVTAIVRQAINDLAAQVVAYVSETADDAGRFKVLLTGGGAIALYDKMVRQFARAELVPEAGTANARGLAKIAQRPNFLVKGDDAQGVRMIGIDPGNGFFKVAEVQSTLIPPLNTADAHSPYKGEGG